MKCLTDELTAKQETQEFNEQLKQPLIKEEPEDENKKKDELIKRKKKIKEVIANTIMSIARIAS